MRLSLGDAAAYAAMVGFGETYFLADAIRLGASPLQQGLVVGLPMFVGSAGPLAMLWLLARAGARRPLVVAAALAQAAVLLALAFSHRLAIESPLFLIVAACVYQVCGQAAGTAWSSWYGDVVPTALRGRYFARRNRLVYGATCVGLLCGGLLLHLLEPAPAGAELATGVRGAGFGFRVIFLVAAACRLVSCGLLAASPEPRFHAPRGTPEALRFLSTERGTGARRLVLTIAALHLAVWTAAPYFGPHMLTTLSFSYLEYTTAYVCMVVLKVTLLPWWGRALDQHGARSTGALAIGLLALLPLPWLWAQGLGWVLFAQAVSGASWAGFELCQFALVLESSYRRTRAHVFAALAVANGLAQLSGTLIGAALLAASGGSWRLLFVVSTVLRLAVALVFPRVLPAPVAGRAHRADLLLRVIGLRPTGGVVHRPLPAPDPDAERADGPPPEPQVAGSCSGPGPGSNRPRRPDTRDGADG